MAHLATFLLTMILGLARTIFSQAPEQQNFVCFSSPPSGASGGFSTVPPESLCNGVHDCPNGEDETICAGDEDGDYYGGPAPPPDYFDYPDAAAAPSDPIGAVPDGFVRLPDSLQQKQYYGGGTVNFDYGAIRKLRSTCD